MNAPPILSSRLAEKKERGRDAKLVPLGTPGVRKKRAPNAGNLVRVVTPYSRLSYLVPDWSVVYTRSRSLPRKARCARAAGHAVIWRSHRRGRRPRRPGGKTRTSCLLRRIHTMLHTYRRGDSPMKGAMHESPGGTAFLHLTAPANSYHQNSDRRGVGPTTKPYSVTASP